ncbi:MAG: pyridoxal phosphate-dependent aminotransferase [Veillonella sp.]|uniref:pyridoxal phosphate-dependent aminotransferase n=1 Tax=Veillonella sp. TaxID=1926307 RepID=UPI0025CD9A94|nr:pyridoxal phosphate-dependent aminotransferase [Veillonella sp.]MBS4914141.1 pyridoxal phosphate-dependent aminotransferase [Veillonella sp.]
MNWDSYISNTAKQLPPSGIRKIWEMALTMDNVLSLGVGEPDYAPPEKVLDACIASLQRKETGYTSNAGLFELRTAIRKWYYNRYHVDYTEDEIMLTIGASEGIDLSMRVLVDEGDEVLIPDPCYVAYPAEVKLAGGVPVMVPTTLEDGFKITPEAIEKAITPRTKVLLMGYPSNPTGAILSKEELEKIAAVAIKHDLIVVSDEIYSELTYGRKHTSIASLPYMKERTVTLNGFSKAYAMTGLRIGFMCAPKEVIQQALKIHQYSIVAPATPVQHGAIVALNECDDAIEAMREEYHARRDLIVSGFQRMGLPIAVPDGAFYVFPNISQCADNDMDFAVNLLQSEHVALVPGSAFGACGRGHIRCSYASSRETIKEALERIERFINSTKAK